MNDWRKEIFGESGQEVSPVVATVQAGDRLIFLMPQLGDHKQENEWYEQLSARYPDVNVSVVPASGVVHIPAPLRTVEIPDQTVLCGHMHTEEGMRGFYLCKLPSRSSYPHTLHWSSRGNKTWTKDD